MARNLARHALHKPPPEASVHVLACFAHTYFATRGSIRSG